MTTRKVFLFVGFLLFASMPFVLSSSTTMAGGTGCSPGFYKNHLTVWVGICCDDTSTDPSCAELLEDLTCRGSDASCGRSAAAAFLDACTGCSE
jgi:hypothetical protein